MDIITVQGRQCVRGVDVSDWQNGIDHQAIANDGIAFLVSKATEGLTYRAKTYATNRDGSKAAGLKFGAYHWIKPSSSGGDQARHFLAATNNGQGCDFLVLDAEEAGLTNAHVEDWCNTVKDATGLPIAIYCGTWTDPKIRTGAWAAHTPWLAAYPAGYTIDPDPSTLRAPAPPAPWGRWDIWQYSSSGRVAGVSGNCDVNVADINWFNTLGAPAATEEDEDMHFIQRTSDGTAWLVYSSGFRINLSTMDGVTGDNRVAALKYVGVEEKPQITDPNADWWITGTGKEVVGIDSLRVVMKMILDAIAKIPAGGTVDPDAISDAVWASLKTKL
jgi:GH25 family lysozyme M1 (1,4-beta-N-acetylmuramidase)